MKIDHLTNLEEALFDNDAFVAAFEQLKADPTMKAAEMKALAKEFAKETATSKAKALHFIWGRHASIMGARARAEATNGRTAA